MPKILMIDDDRPLMETVGRVMSFERSYVFKPVPDPAQALGTAVSWKPDLILLDIKMPGGDGRQIIKSLKENPVTSAIPVIFLTGMAGAGDKVLGLDLGADDYLAKPFDPMELMARIRAVLRRASAPAAGGEIVEAGGIKIDRPAMRVTFRGKPLKFQAREFEILYQLVSSAGKTLSRVFLMESSSSSPVEASTRSVDAHIKNIRKKLGPGAGLIETVPKFGYRFFSEDK